MGAASPGLREAVWEWQAVYGGEGGGGAAITPLRPHTSTLKCALSGCMHRPPKQAAEAGQANLWRSVSAWLSAGPRLALPQWSQCGGCHLTVCVSCLAGGWGSVACPPPPGGQWVARSQAAASPRNTFPQEDLCPLGLQRAHVCFQYYTRLLGTDKNTEIKIQALTRRQASLGRGHREEPLTVLGRQRSSPIRNIDAG